MIVLVTKGVETVVRGSLTDMIQPEAFSSNSVNFSRSSSYLFLWAKSRNSREFQLSQMVKLLLYKQDGTQVIHVS